MFIDNYTITGINVLAGLISLGVEGLVLVEEFQAGFVVNLGHIPLQVVSSSKDLFESVVPEADEPVFLNAVSVVYFADVRPHTGAEAHMAGFPGGVEFAAGEVVGAQTLARFTYGLHLAVAGRVIVPQYAIVPPSDNLPVLDNHAPERPAVSFGDSFPGLINRQFTDS